MNTGVNSSYNNSITDVLIFTYGCPNLLCSNPLLPTSKALHHDLPIGT